MLDVEQKAKVCANALSEAKAEDIVLLDLRGISPVTDVFVVASGDNPRMLKGAARHVLEELRQHGEKPYGYEGLGQADWILLDFSDVIVHIFDEEKREFYDLELLWGDAARLPWRAPHRPSGEGTE